MSSVTTGHFPKMRCPQTSYPSVCPSHQLTTRSQGTLFPFHRILLLSLTLTQCCKRLFNIFHFLFTPVPFVKTFSWVLMSPTIGLKVYTPPPPPQLAPSTLTLEPWFSAPFASNKKLFLFFCLKILFLQTKILLENLRYQMESQSFADLIMSSIQEIFPGNLCFICPEGSLGRWLRGHQRIPRAWGTPMNSTILSQTLFPVRLLPLSFPHHFFPLSIVFTSLFHGSVPFLLFLLSLSFKSTLCHASESEVGQPPQENLEIWKMFWLCQCLRGHTAGIHWAVAKSNGFQAHPNTYNPTK